MIEVMEQLAKDLEKEMMKNIKETKQLKESIELLQQMVDIQREIIDTQRGTIDVQERTINIQERIILAVWDDANAHLKGVRT